MKKEDVIEKFNFRVNVDGFPEMFMSGNSPGEVKTALRKLVKQPSMVKSVDRVTTHDMKKQRRKQAQVGETLDYGSDASVKLMKKMTPGQNETRENRRDRLRNRLAMIGKDMEKTNNQIKKAAGIKDKPKQRLGHDGKPYKSIFFKDD